MTPEDAVREARVGTLPPPGLAGKHRRLHVAA